MSQDLTNWRCKKCEKHFVRGWTVTSSNVWSLGFGNLPHLGCLSSTETCVSREHGHNFENAVRELQPIRYGEVFMAGTKIINMPGTERNGNSLGKTSQHRWICVHVSSTAWWSKYRIIKHYRCYATGMFRDYIKIICIYHRKILSYHIIACISCDTISCHPILPLAPLEKWSFDHKMVDLAVLVRCFD